MPSPAFSPRFTCVLVAGLALPGIASAATLTVGPGKMYSKVSDAIAAAKSGDTIEIDAGEYVDDTAKITVGDLTIRGVGGRPHLKATLPPPNQKGIFAIDVGVGPVTVENIEFSGAQIPENLGNNAAGIRAQGTDLRVKNCYFHDNQNGILASDGLMTVEYSEFAYNGYAGYEHNIYVGTAPKFVFRGNYSHHAKSGHAVKSRALENHIEYNRLMEEADGTGSALIDLPQGGLSYVIGNLIEKGPMAENKNRVIYYKGEGQTNPDLRLFVSHNTFVNDGSPGVVFVDVRAGTDATVVNNLFVGMGTPINLVDPMTKLTDMGNLQTDMPGLVDRAGYDYHLVMESPAIGVGVAVAPELVPMWHYEHPTTLEPRPVVDAPDVGAYEFGDAPVDSTGGDMTTSGGDTTTTGASDTTPGSSSEVDVTGESSAGSGSDSAGVTDGGSGGAATTDAGATGGSSGVGSDGASGTDGTPGDDGCSCHTAPTSPGWALLGLGGLLLRRRRPATAARTAPRR